MTDIKISLSTGGIRKAIAQLKAYREAVDKKSGLLIQKLTEHGLNVSRAVIAEMGINDTGNLLNSVDGYYSPALNAGFIRVSCDYACFVEFGTGVIGKGKPYPAGEIMAEAGYRYMGGTHYVTLLDGRVGWYYPIDDGRSWRFTQGMPSRPFMYETAQDMHRNLEKIVKEVFN